MSSKVLFYLTEKKCMRNFCKDESYESILFIYINICYFKIKFIMVGYILPIFMEITSYYKCNYMEENGIFAIINK